MSSERCLSDFAEIIMGQSPSGEACNVLGNGIALLNGPTEFGNKHPSPVQFTTDPKRTSLSGDLLFCVRGSTTGRMNWADREYAIGRGLAAIRGKYGYPNSFIRAVIEVNLKSLLVQATGSTFPNVSRDLISALPVASINQESAKLIASILEPLDDRITLLRETNATLEAIAQTLFKSWFVDFDPVRAKMEGRTPEGMDEATAALFPDSFEPSELGEVPSGWHIGRLDDLLVLQRGFDLPAQDRVPGPYPIIAASGPSGTHTKAMVSGPCVITGRSGVLGRIFLCLDEFWPLNTTLWVKEFKAATVCYAYEVLKLLDLKSFNAGSAVPTLNRNHIHGLPYLIPRKDCIELYESIVMPMHDKARHNEEHIQALTSLRETLLPRLVSGQLQLPEMLTSVTDVVDGDI
jgi:type I restriction enzyme S subunit